MNERTADTARARLLWCVGFDMAVNRFRTFPSLMVPAVLAGIRARHGLDDAL